MKLSTVTGQPEKKHAFLYNTMKTLASIAIAIGCSSCAGFPFFEKPELKKDIYERGFQAGRAQEIARVNRDMVNLTATPQSVEYSYKPVTIPEQRLPDGVVIEEHVEYVQTVN